MKVDQVRVDFKCVTLAMLIGYAFRTSPDRVAGPAWMTSVGTPRFLIAATLPRNAPKDQVPEMFQALLAERFSLIVHRETAIMPVYALVVARGGLKIRSSSGLPTPNQDTASSPDAFYGAVQARSFADPVTGSASMISNPHMGTVRETGDPNRVQRWEAPDISFRGLADLLDYVAPLPLPIVDTTGLSGRYSLVLEVSLRDLAGPRRQNSADPQPDLEETTLAAFNSGLLKLGLRLERRKGPVETVVVDHVKRSPTDN